MTGSSHGTARRRAAWAGVAALLCGCAGAAQASPTAPAPEIDHVVDRGIVEWDDGLDHVVVSFAPAAPGTPLASAAPEPAPAPAPEAAPSVSPATNADDSVLVVRGDDRMRRQVRDGSLRVVTTLSAAERAAVAEAEGEAMAVVVVDPDGAVGPPGDRYLMTPGALRFIGEPTVAAPVEAPVDAPIDVPAQDVAAVAAEREALLLTVPGVVSAVPVTADVYAVATSGARDDLAEVAGVVSVVEDLVVGLFDDPSQPLQWWLDNNGGPVLGSSGVVGADVNARPAWGVSRGSGVVIAVIDTGVDPTHPDLAGRMWTNPREVCGNGIDDDRNARVDDCAGWDFANNDADPSPDAGVTSSDHGTHVAGIAASSANGVGIVGVAPEATIMPLKVMTSTGVMPGSAIQAAIMYAADNGATVINLSLGTALGTTRSAVAGWESAVSHARSKGVTIVAAAGNSAVDIGVQTVWPANFSLYHDNVITVSASTNSDRLAAFSNFGAPVVIAAPGQHLYSTLPGGRWGYKSGTSMSAPVVAGAAAVHLASPMATSPAALRTRLVATAAATAAGARLDVGAALGLARAGDTRTVRATYEGTDALVPEQVGTLGVRIRSTAPVPTATGVRMHLAARVGGQVYAVDSFPAIVSTPSSTAQLTTDAAGSFPTVALTDTAALASTTGLRLDLGLRLPAGDFAVVTELVDASGAVVGGSSVGYLTVAEPLPGGSPPSTTSATVPGPVTTVPVTSAPATTAPGGGAPPTTTGGPVTTSPAPGTSLPVATTTPDPGAPTPSSPSPVTTSPVPSPTSPSPVTTSPAVTSPGTSPAVTSPVTTSPATTSPAVTSPVTTSPVTTSPAVTSPGTSPTTPPTTPEPERDTSGPWRLESMSPRIATIDGGTTVTLVGSFPTTVPVFVWFGDLGIVQAESTGSTLTASTPAVAGPAITDVSVRFRTGTSHTLTLADAFTFVARSQLPPTTEPLPSTTAPVAPTTTTQRGTATTSPATTSPATTSPATTSPATTSPATTSPATSPTVPVLGSLRLRPVPTAGTLTRLSASAWPASGCRTASCSSSSL